MITPDRLLTEAGAGDPGAASAWPALARTLVAHLRDSEAHLPKPGLDALDVATAHWSGSRDSDALINAKVRVWEFLQAKHRSDSSGGIHDDKDRAMRALLCVLEEPEDTEAEADTAEWFCTMINALAETS